MHAIIRRYDGVDQNRTAELTGKVNETLVPKLEKLSGFAGYFLIEAGNGVFSSLGLFETAEIVFCDARYRGRVERILGRRTQRRRASLLASTLPARPSAPGGRARAAHARTARTATGGDSRARANCPR